MNTTHKFQFFSANRGLLDRATYVLALMTIVSVAWAQPANPVNCPQVCLPITIRRFPDRPIKNTIPPDKVDVVPLPKPAFGLPDGNVPYGTGIPVSAVGLPAGATVEFSTDGGTTWITGQQISVLTEATFLARARQNDRVSETVQGRFAPYFRRTFVLGNSITAISAVPSIGWFGNWGMAASAADKDYLHLLTNRLKERNPDVKIQAIAGSGFERTWWTYQLASSLDEHLTFPPDQQGPDLIIVRLGENIDDALVQDQNLEAYFGQLLDHLKKFSTGPVKIVVTTTFWQGQDRANGVFRKVAAVKGYSVADLNTLATNPAYRATQFADPGLAQHPNDLGMQRIAELIWEQIK